MKWWFNPPSHWATSMGSIENPAKFKVCCGSKNCGPQPLVLHVGEPRETGWPYKTHLMQLDQHTGCFSISSEAVSSAPQKRFKEHHFSCSRKTDAAVFSGVPKTYQRRTRAKRSKTVYFTEGTSLRWPKRIRSIFLYECSLGIPIIWRENRD